MQQVFLERGQAIVHQVPEPLLDAHAVALQVHYSFISMGTESATLVASGTSLSKKVLNNLSQSITKVRTSLQENGITGTLALIKGAQHQSLEIGYSCAGQVIAVGEKVRSIKVGDFVAAGGSGLANHAELVAVPEHLVAKVTDKEMLKQASVTTIGAIALQGFRRADLRLGETVCIVGLGLLGQITVQLAKAAGLHVIGIDIDVQRCELARTLGCDYIINPRDESALTTTAFITNHKGVDATIITAASTDGALIQQAVEMTRRKGKVVLVGDVKIDFPREPLYQKEIDFLISCSYGPGRYDVQYEREGIDYPYAYVRWTEQRNMQLIADLICSKKLIIDPCISAEFSLETVQTAYESLGAKTYLGMVIAYDTTHEPRTIVAATIPQGIKKYTAPHGQLKVAMIGVGGFTKTKLIPILQSMPEVKIAAIVDINITAAINVARQNGHIPYYNDYEAILQDDRIDAAIIATPHGHHAEQTIKLLKAGKAVYVEKPAAVTSEQLKQLALALQSPDIVYGADFNRSWSLYAQKIRAVTAKRTVPLMMSYRMNAGYLPQEHWIQSEEHRGRIIGEACHILEFFMSTIDARPISLHVETLGGRADLQPSDNVSAQLVFEDGSQAHLLYVSTGNTSLTKERLEVFFDGKSIIMEDYNSLIGYGLPKSFNHTTRNADKGHATLLKEFVAHALSPASPPPVPYERIILTTELSILIHELACQGGGSISLDALKIITGHPQAAMMV